MPFDPSKPANSTPLSSAEMRSQLTSLNDDIQTRATVAQLAAEIAAAIAGTSSNSNGVATLGQTADANYNPIQMQQLLDKLDQLIDALRR